MILLGRPFTGPAPSSTISPFLSIMNPSSSTAPAETHFDAYEVHGVREYAEDKDGTKFCEQVEDGEAMFWSLYGHLAEGGLLCIGDFQTRKDAEDVMARITGGNARLIAAAPYLLERAKALLANWENGNISGYIQSVANAIAEAEGR